MKKCVIAALALCLTLPAYAFTIEGLLTEGVKLLKDLPLTGEDNPNAKEKPAQRKESAQPASVSVAADQRIDVAFSPDHGAEELVLKSIKSAKKEIRLAAYSFTAAPVVKALTDAKKRGVDVKVVADHKHNYEVCKGGSRCHGAVALSTLVNADIQVRTVTAYAIQHDKFIVIDGKHTQTGSYNYSKAAATSNAENVMVIWNNPAIASKYLDQWKRHWDQGTKAPLKY